MNRFAWSIFIMALFCLFLFACGDDDDQSPSDQQQNDDDAQTDDDQSDDDADDDTSPPDALTSASPQRDSSLLSEGHTGWKNADCFSCHQDVHLGGFIPGECVSCHGDNGATRRPAGHQNSGCLDCHADKHPDMNFEEKHCTACHKYVSDITCPITEDYDAVVIGAGGGGLAAANLLSQAGLKTALVERMYKVGGYMKIFKRGDYNFDASLHAMGGFDPPDGSKSTADDFTTLGIMDKIQPVKCDPIYRSVFPNDTVVDIPADIDEYFAMLKTMFPDQSQGLDDMRADLDGMYIALDAVMGLQQGFNSDDLMIVLTHLQSALNLLRYNNMTLRQFIEQYIDNEELIGIWTQLVTYVGLGPDRMQALYFITMWQSYQREGFYYLVGGSGSVSDAEAEVIEQNGGVIKLNTKATKIVIENNKAVQVQTENDACLNTRYVVSNANAVDTLLHMVGEENLPADYAQGLKDQELGAATFQVFLGVDHDYRDLFDGSHEITINTSFNQDENFQYIQNGDLDHVPFIIADYSEVDPTAAPEGKNAITLTTYMPYEYMETWRWNESYQSYSDFRKEKAQVLIERAQTYLPGLADHIEVMEVATPVTNWAFSLNPKGTIFGWANTVKQSTLNRLKQQTPIDNLILAGAWTFPGGGQSAVIGSGMEAARMILKMEEASK